MILNAINIILIILLLCLFIYIFYNMFAENKLMKNYVTKETEKYKKNRKNLIENFENAEKTVKIKSLDSKYHDFPLSELVIKSSYNSAIDNEKKASLEALTEIIRQGYRLCDLELHTRSDKDNKPQVYVSYSLNPKNGVMETEPTITINQAFDTIATHAFSGTSPTSNDPMFIHMRVVRANKDTYRIIADALKKSLSNKLANGKVTSATTYSEIMGKAVIILDYSLSSKCDICDEFVNIYSSSTELPTYSYVTYNNMQMPTIMVNPTTERTDNKRFFMVLPNGMNASIPPMKTPCHMFLARNSEDLNTMFYTYEYAVCPLGKIQKYINTM